MCVCYLSGGARGAKRAESIKKVEKSDQLICFVLREKWVLRIRRLLLGGTRVSLDFFPVGIRFDVKQNRTTGMRGVDWLAPKSISHGCCSPHSRWVTDAPSSVNADWPAALS